MINFPVSWGIEWDPRSDLDPVWKKVKMGTPGKQSSLI